MTSEAHRLSLAAILGGIALLALALAAWRLAVLMPPGRWWEAALHPNLDDPRDLVFAFSALPRLATAALCGAALGLGGALLQHALANPLASPTTLGVESGGQLALTIAVIFAPALAGDGRGLVALLGGGAALGAVFLCARASGLSSISVVLAGFVVALFCTSLSACLKLLNEEYATVLFLWGGGSLEQADWSVPEGLAWRLAAIGGLTLLALRPLSILTLADDSARALGAPVAATRLAALVLALLLTSIVVGAVGTIGFVGLAAPQIARLAGARLFVQRAPLSALVGAALLVAVDCGLALVLSGEDAVSVPTGAATALLGAPLLVWLLPRLRLAAAPTAPIPLAVRPGGRPVIILTFLAALLGLAVVIALAVGRDAGGMTLASLPELAAFAPWRVPRTLVAATAGAMLAVTGLLLQRMTGNPLASPEVLGIGAGVAFGIALGLTAFPTAGAAGLLLVGAAGAAGATAILIAFGARSRFQPEHILLAGIALTSLLDVFVLAFFARGDLRTAQLLGFISGSTYRAGWSEAWTGLAAAALLVPCALLLSRILDLLPLGDPTARALGLPLARTRLALTGLVAMLTAAGILLAGPLSFVGLMGPHLARFLGLRRAFGAVIGAALIGALVMVTADWIARIAIFPRQLPAGLVAALIGLPYLLRHLGRRAG
ncbi:Fe(3+)-hydroxamate ABC transporter permease FhuB [Enterovirga rhinocerotis]|uniref:Iron complex transport system permease protein n=1 Tax=Enterovirga rhinocerotis TaxID=1339210 RepID=A0A4R7BKR3_9HYPH|nr:Fe(3+)-hydroxamate ABC transporter permease FhuB [Enterovirga rhinocerotis]TDR85172.1 iron complex transport system permease protein [Enterovirga rhinocerotis]